MIQTHENTFYGKVKSTEILWIPVPSLPLDRDTPACSNQDHGSWPARRSPTYTKRWFAFKRHRHDSVRDRATRDDPRISVDTIRLNDVHRKTGENRRKPGALVVPNVVARHTKKGPVPRAVTTNYSAMQTEKTNEHTSGKRGRRARKVCKYVVMSRDGQNLFLLNLRSEREVSKIIKNLMSLRNYVCCLRFARVNHAQ